MPGCRFSLIIVGDAMKLLQSCSDDWRQLLFDAKARGCYINTDGRPLGALCPPTGDPCPIAAVNLAMHRLPDALRAAPPPARPFESEPPPCGAVPPPDDLHPGTPERPHCPSLSAPALTGGVLDPSAFRFRALPLPQAARRGPALHPLLRGPASVPHTSPWTAPWAVTALKSPDSPGGDAHGPLPPQVPRLAFVEKPFMPPLLQAFRPQPYNPLGDYSDYEAKDDPEPAPHSAGPRRDEGKAALWQPRAGPAVSVDLRQPSTAEPGTESETQPTSRDPPTAAPTAAVVDQGHVGEPTTNSVVSSSSSSSSLNPCTASSSFPDPSLLIAAQEERPVYYDPFHYPGDLAGILQQLASPDDGGGALAPPARPSAALGPVPVGAPQPPSPAGAPASPPPKRPRPDAEGVQPPPPKRPVPGAADGAAGAGAAGDLAPASQSALATAPAPTPTALKVVRGVLPPGTDGPSFPKPKAPARRSQPLAMPAMLNAMHRLAAVKRKPRK